MGEDTERKNLGGVGTQQASQLRRQIKDSQKLITQQLVPVVANEDMRTVEA